jgi:Uma2 family endonuclease
METSTELKVRPLLRVEYDALVEQGFFDDDEHIELLEGQLVVRETEGDDHARTQRSLLRTFFEAVPASEADIGAGNPLGATRTSEPEPDVCLFPPVTDRGSHPTTATLVIEVSNTSLRRDLMLKARIYAQADIVDYWVVDLVHRTVVVHRTPTPSGYADVTNHVDGELRPLRHPQAVVDVARLFA